MKFKAYVIGFACLCLCSTRFCAAAVWYVDASRPDNNGPGTSLANAWQIIQSAIDNPAVAIGDLILVAPGIYNKGGKASVSPTNRVMLTKSVTVKAISTDPAATIIEGAADTRGGSPNYGATAVRCAYVGANCELVGFTLTNGWTSTGTQNTTDRYGGGVFCESTSILSNCVVKNCQASLYAGGVYRGTLYNCVIADNSSASTCGGVLNASLYAGCVVRGNTCVSDGGGMHGCSAFDSSIVSNRSGLSGANSGGGAFNCTLLRCEVLYNTSANGGGLSGGKAYSCKITGNTALENGFGSSGGGGGYGAYLEDCLIAYNIAPRGGGLGGTITAYNCQIVSNTSTSYGGGFGNQWANMTASNCLFQGNSAVSTGAGVQGVVKLENCIIKDNKAGSDPAAAYLVNSFVNCLIVDNKRTGATIVLPASTYVNCTIANNNGAITGGSTLQNCIVYSNYPANLSAANYAASYTCVATGGVKCTFIGGFDVNFNTTNNPLFVKLDVGNYRLADYSPCIDSGTNLT